MGTVVIKYRKHMRYRFPRKGSDKKGIIVSRKKFFRKIELEKKSIKGDFKSKKLVDREKKF